MPTFVAIVIVLLLIALVPIPALVAMSRPRAAFVAVPFYLVLVVGLATYHVGLWSGESVAMPAPATAVVDNAGTAAGPPAQLCEQALTESERVGLIVNRASRPRVTVKGDMWAQLPQQVKDGLVACLEATRPQGLDAAPVEIVEQ